jgi:hypothetical protein
MTLEEQKSSKLTELNISWGMFLHTYFPQAYINHLQALFNGSVLSNYIKRMQMLEEIYKWVYETVTQYKNDKVIEVMESETPSDVEYDFNQFLAFKPNYTLEQLMAVKE